MRKTMTRTAGFSLVEVLCAILILGIGMTGLVHGIATALSASKESELQTAAALIAAGRIETLRAEGFLMAGTDDGECEAPLALYRWKQEIGETDIDGLYDVQVAVEHSGSGKVIYELQTLLFDPPPLATQDETGDGRNDRRRDRRRQ